MIEYMSEIIIAEEITCLMYGERGLKSLLSVLYRDRHHKLLQAPDRHPTSARPAPDRRPTGALPAPDRHPTGTLPAPYRRRTGIGIRSKYPFVPLSGNENNGHFTLPLLKPYDKDHSICNCKSNTYVSQ